MLVCWDTQACVSIRNPTGWYLLGLWPHTGKAGQRLRMPAPLEALARLLGDPPQPSLETLLLPVRGTWGEAGGGGAPQVPEAPLLQVGSTGPGARRRSQKRLCCQCAARRRRGRGGGAPQVPEAQAAVVARARPQSPRRARASGARRPPLPCAASRAGPTPASRHRCLRVRINVAAQEYGSAWQPRAQAGEPRVTQGCQSLLRAASSASLCCAAVTACMVIIWQSAKITAPCTLAPPMAHRARLRFAGAPAGGCPRPSRSGLCRAGPTRPPTAAAARQQTRPPPSAQRRR